MKILNALSIDFYKDQKPGRIILLSALFLFALALPLSPYLVSVSQFLLLLGWLIEGDFKFKIKQLKENTPLHLFLILPLLHVIWLLNTSDFHYAFHDIKIKLPLLVFPIILGTTRPLSEKNIQLALRIFVFGVFSATVAISAILLNIYPYPHSDIREASAFISHIRFGLMIVFSLVLIGKYIDESLQKKHQKTAILLFVLLIWFLFFLVILQSVTSWVILFLLVFFLFFFYYNQIKNKLLKLSGWFVLSFMVLSSVGLIAVLIHNFYYKATPEFSSLPQKTPRGNVYLNDTSSVMKENGHYVRILISYKELSQTWPELSQVPFNGKDASGYPIWSTMIRYLASKGLPKDRDGLLALDQQDIEMIEQGYASCVYRMNFIPYIRSYSLLWELDRYFKSGNANKKSVPQRLEYLKAARYIISHNFWLGIGTGDLKNAYEKAFIDMKSKLDVKNRNRAHNQFVTFFVTFGIFGFILSLLGMFGPVLKYGQRSNFLLAAFVFIVLMSMINEDTLETQAGVSFYIYFYTLLIFSSKNLK